MRLVLLDRDGVLNEDRPTSVRSPDELIPIPRAAGAVARLNRAGLRVAVCTNQSILGRGIIDETMLDSIHARLAAALTSEGAHLDAIFVAPDAPDRATSRRKPGPAMLQEALARFAADPAETPMIGDSLRDLQAAGAAGCQRHLVLTGKGRDTARAGLPPELDPVTIHEDLWHAVDHLLATR